MKCVACVVYPQLTGKIIEDWFDVSGLAIADNKIFAVCRRSSCLHVFDAQMPHTRLYEMVVAGLVSPADLAVCHETVHLYVADDRRESPCVWKLDPRALDSTAGVSSGVGGRCKATKFISTTYGPYALSVTESTRHLVVTPDSSVMAFFVYDADDGRLVRRVDTRSDFKVLHAVEIPVTGGSGSTTTFIVSHTYWRELDGHVRYHLVSELDCQGLVVTSCDGRQREVKRTTGRQCERSLLWPLHVAAVSGGVLVADKGNEQVVFLNWPHHEHSGRVLISRTFDGIRREIRRLCYDPSTEQLVVGFDEDGIGVYTWSS